MVGPPLIFMVPAAESMLSIVPELNCRRYSPIFTRPAIALPLTTLPITFCQIVSMFGVRSKETEWLYRYFVANKGSTTGKVFERCESSRKLYLEVLRDGNRIAVDRDGAARIVGAVASSSTIEPAIKDKWFDGLSCCARAQQCNGKQLESGKKHLARRIELERGITELQHSTVAL